MSTKTIAIIVIVLVVIAGLWYAVSAQQAAAPTATDDVTETSATMPETPAPGAANDDSVTDITLTDAGFSPKSVTINVGDTVRFTNNSGGRMWVGANDHPTHTTYDGTSTKEHCVNGASTGTFDQCTGTAAGSTWDYTFTKTGTFGYHNHANASQTGTITVR